jgi:ABC-type transport system involved in cytochrome c biogenesis permease subunit
MTAFLLLLIGCSGAFADDLDFSTLRYLAIYKDVRKKPLDTVAVETLQKISGKRTYVDPASGRKLQPMDVLLSMWFATRDWQHAPVILLSYEPLKARLGLAADRNLFSYAEIASPQFQQFVSVIQQKEQRKESLTREEREAKLVHERLDALSESVGPDSLAVVPPPTPTQKWVPLPGASDYYGEAKQAELQKLAQNLAAAYSERDPSAFSTASAELLKFLRGLNPSAYPSPELLRREVHYNSFHPLRKAVLLYLISFIVLLTTWRMKRPAFYWIGIGAFFAGVVTHGYAFWLRYMISGRAPVTNMYESVIWVSFGAALFALLLELASRERYFIAGAAPLSVVLLLLADQFPAVLDPSIGPLMPVLRNNWLIWIHVPTITLGYAAFALTLGVGHIALGYYLFAPQAKAAIAKLETLIYRAMQVGVLMIAAGTILGGIWAHYAWGRFWGWDPKETWALITLLCYLVPLHGRLAGWMSNFSLTVASIVCFLPVLMAWYGVNFILGKGLHSYGFGVGGYWYAVAFVLVELALVGIATWRRNHAAIVEPPRQPVSAAFPSHS